MIDTPPIIVLWDYSHMWGLMVLRALSDLGFPIRLLKGNDIAQGALFRKQGPESALLIVPGGSARIKAEALGSQGRKAIQDFVAQGGAYLGFCGGAGLALSHSRGLDLCPWVRASYPERFLHLLSGYVIAKPCSHALTPDFTSEPSLPVWWPGRFGNCGGDVEVLARYKCPGNDFWIADIALSSLPEHVFHDWQELYGVNLSGDFLLDSELIVHGEFGKGEYILSYSHLETPSSPDANAWLTHVLAVLTKTKAQEQRHISDWNLLYEPKLELCDGSPKALQRLYTQTRSLIQVTLEQRLFFRRTSWLLGWKPGLPGSLCNSLLAALVMANTVPSNAQASAWWQEQEAEIVALADEFFTRAEGFFYAARLADTLTNIPDAVNRISLSKERDRLFGHPMLGGGMLGSLLSRLEEYLYLCYTH